MGQATRRLGQRCKRPSEGINYDAITTRTCVLGVRWSNFNYMVCERQAGILDHVLPRLCSRVQVQVRGLKHSIDIDVHHTVARAACRNEGDRGAIELKTRDSP